LIKEYEIFEPKPHVTMRRREKRANSNNYSESIKEEHDDDEI
jgi:hypothetical protein